MIHTPYGPYRENQSYEVEVTFRDMLSHGSIRDVYFTDNQGWDMCWPTTKACQALRFVCPGKLKIRFKVAFIGPRFLHISHVTVLDSKTKRFYEKERLDDHEIL